MSSQLKLVPNSSVNYDLFTNIVNKKYKIGLLIRSLNFKWTTFFTGRIDGDKQFYLSYPSGVDIFDFKDKITSVMKDESLLATVMLNGEIVGITFKVAGFSDEGIICKYPENVYQINRRSTKRYPINEKYRKDCYVEMFIPKISPKPLRFYIKDISIHGLSLIITPNFQLLFQKEQVFPNAKIYLRGLEFSSPIEVRNMLILNQPNQFKVGFKFVKIESDKQMQINQFIVAQSK